MAALGGALVPASLFAQGGPAPVVVSPVVEREVSSGQTFVGTVMPLRRAAIGSAVDGRVVEFPIKEGDRVEAGATLAQLLTNTIRLEWEAALAELELRKAELEELENGTRPEEKEQARARMEAARALTELTRAKHERAQRLYAQSQSRAVTADQLEEARAAWEQAQSSWQEAKAAHELAENGPRPETIKQAQARLQTQIAVADRLEDMLKKHTITTHFAGYVVSEHTQIGAWVNRGDLVAEVVELDEVDVVAHVQEGHVAHLEIGASVRVEVPAIPTEAFTGRLVQIVPQADVRARTFPVKVRVQNPVGKGGPMLKSGMLARVTLPTGEVHRTLLVPKDSLVLGGAQPLLFVFDPASKDAKEGKARPVPVELGVASGGLIEVKGDLREGQPVVVEGNERLRPGQDVVLTRVVAAADGE